jgi:cytoskeletal protein RodZ
MTQSDVTQSTVEPNLKPGYRLRSAREAKQLSQEQVAVQLRLSPFQIDSIEKDDYSYVPAQVYARGHLTLYARLVGLPVDEILQTFTQLQPPITRPQQQLEHCVPEKIEYDHSFSSRNKHKLRWLAVGILVIAALVTAIWWVGNMKEKHHAAAAHNIVVAPGDGGEISQQIGDGAVSPPPATSTIPAPVAPEGSVVKSHKSTNTRKTSHATEKDPTNNATSPDQNF